MKNTDGIYLSEIENWFERFQLLYFQNKWGIKFNLMLWLKPSIVKFLIYFSIFLDCHLHALDF